jgi:hypothetical protein
VTEISLRFHRLRSGSDGGRAAVLTVFECGGLKRTRGNATPHVGACETQASAARHVFTVLGGEQLLKMRLLVDRTIVEAFVQGGRVAYTKSHVPADWQHSAVQLVASNGSSALCATAKVWAMGCGWVGVDEHQD